MSVKPRQYCFRAEILPAQLICAFFEMQEIKEPVTRREDLDSNLFGQDMYLNVSYLDLLLHFICCITLNSLYRFYWLNAIA